MTLGRCPLSIFCSRGTPPKSVEPTNPESINAGQIETEVEIEILSGGGLKRKAGEASTLDPKP